ncbi:MAG TPA: SGNH/GDSL hydrolase family protein [Geminicoccus sp.]|jgi:outer membrane lipase/esterase|uniref:SGNH/GDSL hydrolase family protein n=1 Tax=Geminicoccus sp. TaxID=2024832 RepID=UPI002E35B939|nr:SGNH/GDSL hydrolase family protein [Geminicoccus sp.]HEX2529714.1 SGNH/GDSL hydrolase family protein [Geminicoccus sp.]
MRLLRLLFQGIVALSMSLGAAAQAAPTFDRIVVLGDSLSDNGNAGRFSNGPVWVEVLAGRLNVPLSPSSEGGSNYAVGGAQLDPASGPHSLRAQADLLLSKPAPSGRTLSIVWGGANDLFAAASQPDPATKLRASVASLRSVVADLVEHGATDILVLNLPDVGLAPAVQVHGRRAADVARLLTDRFNKETERVLAEIEASASRSLRLTRLDVHALADQVRKDPSAFGFVNISVPCSGRASCDGYLFWDEVHPTSFAHRRLAERALQLLGAGEAAQ